MIRNHLLKFVVPVACSLSSAHSVIPKIPLLEPNDPLAKNISPLPKYYYKGIYPINEYGWLITQRWEVPLQSVEILGKRYEVKKDHYFLHPYLPFALFKVDRGNDAQRDPLEMLRGLVNKVGLESNANWVTSLALVPDPLSHEGRISESLEGYTKPLAVISKVERQGNGALFLSVGGSTNRVYHELWPVRKQKESVRYLENADHINTLLKHPNYRAYYFKKNIPQLAQNKIEDLTQKKEDLKKGYINLVSPKNPADQQEEENHLNHSPTVLKLDREVQFLSSPEFTPEKEILLKEDLDKGWEKYQGELIQERENKLKWKKFLESASESYANIGINLQRWLKKGIVNNFLATHLGIGGKEDHGGLILVGSKNLVLMNNRYSYFTKVAGITYTKEGGFVEGETSIAVDLTTEEVHKWISKTIDEYYNPQNESTDNDKGKRPAEDEDDQPGPSDRNKKPRIKQEPTDDDLAPNPHHAHIKEEIKDEVKQED